MKGAPAQAKTAILVENAGKPQITVDRGPTFRSVRVRLGHKMHPHGHATSGQIPGHYPKHMQPIRARNVMNDFEAEHKKLFGQTARRAARPHVDPLRIPNATQTRPEASSGSTSDSRKARPRINPFGPSKPPTASDELRSYTNL